ncbi:rhomboid family intramembrane serine protease [Mailhella massiliensis]|uniref:Rhomboid family intramembrane serine protease n=1 Tax=Mailhella massiliensis TaxID=1903261 RepID=A0A921DSK5_9BACT|nr:rhomboid family intramembrane serine protease [Mailhella massiliensis]HJD98241.1 rhomboid family intramembrane serine protease [Mailhella massiliensis]
MNEIRAPFRHRPRRCISMWRRSARVPATWRVVDFHGPEYMGRQLPALGTKQMELLRLVLDSRDIPYLITGHGSQARAFVPAMFETIARMELADVASEKPLPPPSLTPKHNAHWAMLVMLFLIFWHGLTMGWWPLPFEHVPDPDYWKMCGRLDVTAVRAGEWWRTATALTLHADSLHLFSNVLFGIPFLLLLARRLGLGLTVAAILVSGMLGNAMNALYRDPGYASLGFSTAMFASVGLLCADIVVRSPARGFRRLALPVAAGLAFLATLGSEGQNTDYAAHIFGLLSGFLIGLAVSFAIRHDALPRPMEWLLGCAAPLFLLLCWKAAL